MGLVIPSPSINKKRFSHLPRSQLERRFLRAFLSPPLFHSIRAQVLAVYIFILSNIGDPLVTMQKDDASAIRGWKAPSEYCRSVKDFHTIQR